MATHSIPYMTVPGSLSKILEKIKTAATPDNFNQDFLANTLGFKGGNYRTFIPWAKKIGLINSDGTPSALYKQFRNPTTSKASLGEALKKGYALVYARDENCHRLDKSKLKGLMMEITGESHDSSTLNFIINSYWNAKELAEFKDISPNTDEEIFEEIREQNPEEKKDEQQQQKIKLGLNYTINLVLPKTDDPAIYNAIFKSLRENLLK